MSGELKWSDLFGIDPDYPCLTDEQITRREVATEIYEALKRRRDEAHAAQQHGWPLLSEAMVITWKIGRGEHSSNPREDG